MSAAGSGSVQFTVNTNSNLAGFNQAQQGLSSLGSQVANTGRQMQQYLGMAGQQAQQFGQQAQRGGAQAQQSFSQTGQAAQRLTQQIEQLHLGNMKLGDGYDFLSGLGGPFARFGQMIEGQGSMLGMLGGAIGGVVGALAGFAAQAASMAAGMGLFQMFSTLTSLVDNFADSVYNVNAEVQQTEYRWQYQFGGPGSGGTYAASQLAGWLPNFAMDVPENWTNIVSGISPLSQLGLNARGVERYLPMIADLAASHTSLMGGNQLPLSYATLAIMEAARTGYTRRMLLELQINPRELEQYGLNFADNEGNVATNPEMFLPALQKYAEAHHYIGTAKAIAHNTVAGAMTSLQDRIMKFQAAAGGMNVNETFDSGYDAAYAQKLNDQLNSAVTGGNDTLANTLADQIDAYQQAHWVFDSSYDPAKASSLTGGTRLDYMTQHRVNAPGTERQGTVFAEIQKALNDLSSWLDAHQDQFLRFASALADLGGGGFQMLRAGVEGLMQGLTQSGAGQAALEALQQIAGWLGDPKNQAAVRDMATAIGQSLGGALKMLIQDAPMVAKDIKDMLAVFGVTNLVQNIYMVGAALIRVTQGMELLGAAAMTSARITIDGFKAMADAAHGNFTGANADAQDMLQAWKDMQAQVQQINSDSEKSYAQLMAQFAQYMAAQQQAATAQTSRDRTAQGGTRTASEPTPPPPPVPSRPAGGSGPTAGPQAAIIGGGYAGGAYGGAGGGYGPGVSYGDVYLTQQFYGLEAGEVRQAAAAAMESATQQQMAQLAAPGAGRASGGGLKLR